MGAATDFAPGPTVIYRCPAGHQRGDVRRDRLGRRELPAIHTLAYRGGFGRGGVGCDDPVARPFDAELPRGLQVGLLEAGVDAPGVRDLELGVAVHPRVDRVDEAVQALSGVAVAAHGGDRQHVLALGHLEVGVTPAAWDKLLSFIKARD